MNKAQLFAQELHAGQLDKAGQMYYGHLLRVANCCPYDYMRTIAFLHDSIEDGKATYDEIVDLFGKRVAGSVMMLSRVDGEDYGQYLRNIVQYGFETAWVKVYDILDNLLIERLAKLDPKEADRLRKKYHEGLKIVLDRMEEVGYITEEERKDLNVL